MISMESMVTEEAEDKMVTEGIGWGGGDRRVLRVPGKKKKTRSKEGN